MKYSLRTLMILATVGPPLLAGGAYLVSSFVGFGVFIVMVYSGICLFIFGYFLRQLIRLTRP
jgi:hypothetical protein